MIASHTLFGIGEEGPLLGFGVFHAMAVLSLATVPTGGGA